MHTNVTIPTFLVMDFKSTNLTLDYELVFMVCIVNEYIVWELLARDSTVRLLAIVIFDLGQIEKTGTIFQLILEIKYKNPINNFITCL